MTPEDDGVPGVVVEQNKLEDDLSTQLDVAGALAEWRSDAASSVREVGVEGVESPGVGGTNVLRRIRVIECEVRRSVVGAVGDVVSVDPKLGRDALVDPDRLEDAHVEFIDRVSAERAAADTRIRCTECLGLILVVQEPMNGIPRDPCASTVVEVADPGHHR